MARVSSLQLGARPMPIRPRSALTAVAALSFLLSGCTPLGSLMSPYSEKFSCKNSDHGQCIHPEQAYEDARAGVASKSQAAVTNDRAMLNGRAKQMPGDGGADYDGYRASLYRELQGLIDAPVTPMLKPARTVRTLILPYTDRQRPDRLYMPRYVYSILDRPEWVVGSSLRGSAQDSGEQLLVQTQSETNQERQQAAPITPLKDGRP